MNSKDNTLTKFEQFLRITLGTFCGFIISMPFFFSAKDKFGALGHVAVGVIVGFLIGYKKRNSRFFLYFTVVCIIILSILMTIVYRKFGAL